MHDIPTMKQKSSQRDPPGDSSMNSSATGLACSHKISNPSKRAATELSDNDERAAKKPKERYGGLKVGTDAYNPGEIVEARLLNDHEIGFLSTGVNQAEVHFEQVALDPEFDKGSEAACVEYIRERILNNASQMNARVVDNTPRGSQGAGSAQPLCSNGAQGNGNSNGENGILIDGLLNADMRPLTAARLLEQSDHVVAQLLQTKEETAQMLTEKDQEIQTLKEQLSRVNEENAELRKGAQAMETRFQNALSPDQASMIQAQAFQLRRHTLISKYLDGEIVRHQAENRKLSQDIIVKDDEMKVLNIRLTRVIEQWNKAKDDIKVLNLHLTQVFEQWKKATNEIKALETAASVKEKLAPAKRKYKRKDA